MRYDYLKNSIRCHAPCTVRVVPVYEEPKGVPFGTLLLSIYGDGSIVALWGEGRTGVSAEQALELLAVAQKQETEEEPVSKIKVGDKVRVAQIVTEIGCATRFDHPRVRLLGMEGTVTHIDVALREPYTVDFSGHVLGGRFKTRELKVLSVPCEQPEPDDAMKGLRAQVTHLLAANERIRRTLAGQYSLSERRRVLLAELREKYDGITRPSDSVERLRKENERLSEEIVDYRKRNGELSTRLSRQRGTIRRLQKESDHLQEEHTRWLAENETVRQKIVDIVNKGMPVW